jgi:hypothetical protein
MTFKDFMACTAHKSPLLPMRKHDSNWVCYTDWEIRIVVHHAERARRVLSATSPLFTGKSADTKPAHR